MSTLQKPVPLTLLLASAMIGCSGDVASSSNGDGTGSAAGGNSSSGGASNPTGGRAGQTSTSVSCIGVSLTDANVNLYSGSALLVVERTGAIDSNYFWSAVVTIGIDGGSQQACTSADMSSPSERFATVQCPALNVGACGTNVNVKVVLGANGYSFASGSTTPACQSPTMTLTYTVPVECPSCPNSYSSGPCDVAEGTSCNYTTTGYTGYGGAMTMSLPCFCNFNSATGARTWSCAVA